MIEELFLRCKELLGLKKLSEELGIHKGTASRWIKNNKVPKEYLFDFYRILEISVEVEKLSFKEKDQFFTSENAAKYCLEVLYKKLKELGLDKNEYTFIEPSAGNGVFFNLLDEKNWNRYRTTDKRYYKKGFSILETRKYH